MYEAQPGVWIGRPPCACGAAARLHADGVCPTAYVETNLDRAVATLARAREAHDQAAVWTARGDVQRILGREHRIVGTPSLTFDNCDACVELGRTARRA